MHTATTVSDVILFNLKNNVGGISKVTTALERRGKFEGTTLTSVKADITT